MKIYFTILLLVIIFATLYPNKKPKAISQNEPLKNNKSQLNLRSALNEFNTTLNRKHINNINKHLSYSTGTFNSNIKNQVFPVIKKILDNINLLTNQRIKLINVSRIERLIDTNNNQQFLIQLFVHRVDIYATSKLIFNYYESNTGKININSIKLERDTFNNTLDINNLYEDKFLPNEKEFRKYKNTGHLENNQRDKVTYGALYSDIIDKSHKKDHLKNTSLIQEPCKYTLHMWNSAGVNKLYKPRKGCSINNNSEQKPAVHLYTNPTVFSSSFINPDHYM